ncbi:MAG: hypothetical protein ACI4PU_08825, partial [Intestinibacter sp.]
MIKLLKKAMVFTITASFVFNSGLGQLLSYAQNSKIYEAENAVISNSEGTNNYDSTDSEILTFNNFTYEVYDSEVTIMGY